MTLSDWFWAADGATLALVVVAGLADWRRQRRANLDSPGWVPWRGLQAAGFFAMLLWTLFALRA